MSARYFSLALLIKNTDDPKLVSYVLNCLDCGQFKDEENAFEFYTRCAREFSVSLSPVINEARAKTTQLIAEIYAEIQNAKS